MAAQFAQELKRYDTDWKRQLLGLATTLNGPCCVDVGSGFPRVVIQPLFFWCQQKQAIWLDGTTYRLFSAISCGHETCGNRGEPW